MSATGTGVVVLPDKAAVAARAAEEFAATAEQAIARNGAFSVALSGGSTPVAMYELLAREPYRSRVEWERVLLFWSDERCVPPDHPDSNYGAAAKALVEPLGLSENSVFRMEGERDPAAAARHYDLRVRETIGGDPPRFDLILLGMGDDGHTASLFPNTEALAETDRLVAHNRVPKLDATRLTFTSTLINVARRVIFLVTGEGKAEALRAVREGEYDPDTYPSQLVHPTEGELLFLVDEPVARLLTRR